MPWALLIEFGMNWGPTVGMLACPCCGGMSQSEETITEICVRCLDCGLQMKRPSDEGLAEVIALWNKRVKLGYRD
jgi:hypothetical protein